MIQAARLERDPVVIAGDLNLSDRAHGYRLLCEGRRDAVRGSFARSTFVGDGLMWRLLKLRIDHIFIPADWSHGGGSSFKLIGSDHHGVRADIGPTSGGGR